MLKGCVYLAWFIAVKLHLGPQNQMTDGDKGLFWSDNYWKMEYCNFSQLRNPQIYENLPWFIGWNIPHWMNIPQQNDIRHTYKLNEWEYTYVQ